MPEGTLTWRLAKSNFTAMAGIRTPIAAVKNRRANHYTIGHRSLKSIIVSVLRKIYLAISGACEHGMLLQLLKKLKLFNNFAGIHISFFKINQIFLLFRKTLHCFHLYWKTQFLQRFCQEFFFLCFALGLFLTLLNPVKDGVKKMTKYFFLTVAKRRAKF